MPAFSTSMSTPPKRFTALSSASSTAWRSVRSQVTPRKSGRFHRLSIAGLRSSADHRGAALEEGLDARLADARRRAGDERDLAGERGRRARLAQLGLLEVPVLDVEGVLLIERAPAAERLGAQDDVDGVLVELFHDRRVLRRAAGGDEAELGVEHHARRRIEHGLLLLRLGRVALEVVPILRGIGGDVAPEHRHGLGADHMVGRRRALLRQPLDVGVLREAEEFLAVVHPHDHRQSRLVGDRSPQLRDLLAPERRSAFRARKARRATPSSRARYSSAIDTSSIMQLVGLGARRRRRKRCRARAAPCRRCSCSPDCGNSRAQ